MIKRHPHIKIQAFLANLPMFSEMSREELDRVAAATVPLYAEKGQAVFQCGDACTGFHVLVYGQVKLGFTSPQGIEKVVEIIRPGQSFGEALMFLDKPYIVFAQAISDAMLLHVARHAVLDELSRDPGFARRMLSGLSRRLQLHAQLVLDGGEEARPHFGRRHRPCRVITGGTRRGGELEREVVASLEGCPVLDWPADAAESLQTRGEVIHADALGDHPHGRATRRSPAVRTSAPGREPAAGRPAGTQGSSVRTGACPLPASRRRSR